MWFTGDPNSPQISPCLLSPALSVQHEDPRPPIRAQAMAIRPCQGSLGPNNKVKISFFTGLGQSSMLKAWSWAVSYMYSWHLLCSGHWQKTASVTVSMGAATNGLLSVTFFDSWVVIVTCDIAACLLFKCKMNIGRWTQAAELLRQSYLQLKHLASRITQTHISGQCHVQVDTVSTSNSITERTWINITIFRIAAFF